MATRAIGRGSGILQVGEGNDGLVALGGGLLDGHGLLWVDWCRVCLLTSVVFLLGLVVDGWG